MIYPSPEVLCVFIFILCSYLFWYYYKLTQAFKNFPTVRIGPKLFYQLCFSKRPHNRSFTSFLFQTLINLAKETDTERLLLLWFFQPMLCIYDGEYMKIILTNESALKKPIFYKMMSEGSGHGIFTHDVTLWKERRKIFNPAFRLDALRCAVPVFNDCGRDLVRQLSDVRGQIFTDTLSLIKNVTLKALFEASFGINTTARNYDKEFEEIRKVVERLKVYNVYKFTRPWHYFNSLEFLFQPKHIKENYKHLHNFSKHIATEIIKSSSEDIGYYKNKTVASVIRENHKKDPSFTVEVIQGEVQTLLIGGYDTSPYTMLTCLFLLAVNPEIQEKAFEEVQSIAQCRDHEFTYSDLNELRYLESVVKETLRLYPTGPFLARETTKDIQCGKYRIPKNTCIVLSPYMMHRNAEYFPEPEMFNPDRFYREKLKEPSAYAPFSMGARNCIGWNYVMIQMKIFLAHVLLNFQVTSPDSEKDVEFEWAISLHPTKPIRLKFTDR